MSIELKQINSNISKLKLFMEEKGLDAFYISSYDNFLNEYVPLDDCHRYYLSGFSGSVAELLVTKTGLTYLFVDGRYHEQADNEITSEFVEVVKCGANKSNESVLLLKIEELKLKSIGVEGNRTSEAFYKKMSLITELISFDNGEIVSILEFGIFLSSPRVETPKDEKDWGGSTKSKLKMILNEGEAYYVSALDSIAWLANIRGYEQPFQSTFLAKAFATFDHFYIFVSNKEPYKNIKHENISIIEIQNWSLSQGLKLIENKESIKSIRYDESALGHADYSALETVFSKDMISNSKGGIVQYHSVKNETEMKLIRDAFGKSDLAIFDTISTIKEILKTGTDCTELDVFNMANKIYKEGGSKEQSFKTISGVGSNSSIIHFGKPSNEKKIGADDLILFDSGAFYEGGFATDTTRTFLGGETAKPWQLEIYTLVLKGLLHAQNAVFPEGTFGSQIDMLARQPLFKYGYNYAHGTGHGVGINVHESGFRISPVSAVPLVLGQIGSIEPGIYLPGKGGVRLENIYEIIKHPKIKNMLTFKPLVYIGYEKALIDFDLLTSEELVWLNEYEAECEKRNRSFL